MKVAKSLHDSRSWNPTGIQQESNRNPTGIQQNPTMFKVESKNSFCFVFVLGEL